jgi:hypothetical protein
VCVRERARDCVSQIGTEAYLDVVSLKADILPHWGLVLGCSCKQLPSVKVA